MALIELNSPDLRDPARDVYVDLATGESGHLPAESRLAELPGAATHSVLATGVTDAAGLGLRIEKTTTAFDAIDHADARSLDDGTGFELLELFRIPTLPALSTFIVRIDTSPVRYFKGLVRAGQAFSAQRCRIEFEELVEDRMIWPIAANLRDDRFTVTSDINESRDINRQTSELLFTLRPTRDGDKGEDAVTVDGFFNNPFPIAKVEFENGDGEIEVPKWIESVTIEAAFSKSYVNSTYLIRINDAGRPETGEPHAEYKFTVYTVDRATEIIDWDPKVVVEDQE